MTHFDTNLDDWGRPEPTLDFDDLWWDLSVLKRVAFLEMNACNESVSVAKMDTCLSRLSYNQGFRLILCLLDCSIPQFRPYLQICCIDRSVSVQHQHNDQQDVNDKNHEHLAEKESGIKATMPGSWSSESLRESISKALYLPGDSTKSDESKAKPSSKNVFKPADPRLTQLIHNLPFELFLQIREDFFNSTLGPRRVYPNNEPLNTYVFESLNKELYLKYRRIFFSENTWVIGHGGYDSVKFLDGIPCSIGHSFQKVELAFKTQDFPFKLLKPFLDEATNDMKNTLGMLYTYRDQCEIVGRGLKMIWKTKFYAVSTLHLKSLDLDLRGAYAPDGEYLGVQIAERLSPFRYGLPAEFVILAPSQALTDQIWEILRERNRRAVAGG